MKIKKIAVLLFAVVMLVGVMASCGSTPKATVKITFMDENSDVIIETYNAELKGENPTVMDAVKAVKDAYATAEGYGQITLSDDESSVKDVDNCKENLTADADGNITYWMFIVNGEEPSGDANEVVVADGDAVVFQFVKEAVETE